jgi:hypothetical protein
VKLLIEGSAFIVCSVLLVVVIGVTAAALVCKFEDLRHADPPPRAVDAGGSSETGVSDTSARSGRGHLTLVGQGVARSPSRDGPGW